MEEDGDDDAVALPEGISGMASHGLKTGVRTNAHYAQDTEFLEARVPRRTRQLAKWAIDAAFESWDSHDDDYHSRCLIEPASYSLMKTVVRTHSAAVAAVEASDARRHKLTEAQVAHWCVVQGKAAPPAVACQRKGAYSLGGLEDHSWLRFAVSTAAKCTQSDHYHRARPEREI